MRKTPQGGNSDARTTSARRVVKATRTATTRAQAHSQAKAALQRYAQSAESYGGLDELRKERIWRRTKHAARETQVPASASRRRRRSLPLGSSAAVAAGLAIMVGFVGYAMGAHQAFGPGGNHGIIDLNGPLPKLQGLPTASPTGLQYPAQLQGQIPAGSTLVSPDGNWVLQYDAAKKQLQMVNMLGQQLDVGATPMGILGGINDDGVLLGTVVDGSEQVTYGYLPDLGEIVEAQDGTNPNLSVTSGTESTTGRWAVLEKHRIDRTMPHQWLSVDGRKVPGMQDAVNLAWNPVGNRLAIIKEGSADNPFQLALYNAVTKRTTMIDDALMQQGIAPGSHDLDWSPGGNLLAVSADGTLKVYPIGALGAKVATRQSITHLGWITPTTLLVSAPKSGQLVVEQWLHHTLVKARGPRVKGDVQQIAPIGNDMALVQTSQGVYVVSATAAVQLVQHAVTKCWYDEINHRVYFAPTGSHDIDVVDVAVNGAEGDLP